MKFISIIKIFGLLLINDLKRDTSFGMPNVADLGIGNKH